MMRSSFNKSLLLLEIVEKKENDDLETLLKNSPDFVEVLKLLLELGLVILEEEKYVLSDKGKNVYYYFNKLDQNSNPLIRV